MGYTHGWPEKANLCKDTYTFTWNVQTLLQAEKLNNLVHQKQLSSQD